MNVFTHANMHVSARDNAIPHPVCRKRPRQAIVSVISQYDFLEITFGFSQRRLATRTLDRVSMLSKSPQVHSTISETVGKLTAVCDQARLSFSMLFSKRLFSTNVTVLKPASIVRQTPSAFFRWSFASINGALALINHGSNPSENTSLRPPASTLMPESPETPLSRG